MNIVNDKTYDKSALAFIWLSVLCVLATCFYIVYKIFAGIVIPYRNSYFDNENYIHTVLMSDFNKLLLLISVTVLVIVDAMLLM